MLQLSNLFYREHIRININVILEAAISYSIQNRASLFLRHITVLDHQAHQLSNVVITVHAINESQTLVALRLSLAEIVKHFADVLYLPFITNNDLYVNVIKCTKCTHLQCCHFFTSFLLKYNIELCRNCQLTLELYVKLSRMLG